MIEDCDCSSTITRSTRHRGFPIGVQEPLWLFDDNLTLKAHPMYHKAKSGVKEAAVGLISDLAVDFVVTIKDKLPNNAIFVAPHAREAMGDNAIPQVFAAVCAMVVQGEVDTDIVQVTRVFHTGADPMERMRLRPEFDGSVTKGANYVLVDDVMNMGGTLAELSSYIQDAGGVVLSVIVLVNAGRVKHLQPTRKTICELEKRYGNEFTKIFGIVPSALTANESNYLIGFRTADEIRNRLVKAREETTIRLRAKGIERKS